MKVAICLKGQPRNFIGGYNEIHREFISKYDTDVFGHCYWDPATAGKNYRVGPGAAPQVIPSGINKILPTLYKFKKFEYEPDKTFPITRHYNQYPVQEPDHDRIIQVMLNQYYSINRVLTLLEEYEKENNIEYDWVCLTRYDILIRRIFSDLNKLDRDKIYVDNYHKGRPFIFNDNLLLMGKHRFFLKDAFEKFDKNYERMLNLTEEDKANMNYDPELLKTDKWNCGETVIAFHLLFKNLLKNVVKSNELDYVMIR
jgi:hypothetical protein